MLRKQLESDRLSAEQRINGLVFDESEPANVILASARCVAQLYPRLLVEVTAIDSGLPGIDLKVIVWAHGSPPVPFFSETVNFATGGEEESAAGIALRIAAEVMRRCTDPLVR